MVMRETRDRLTGGGNAQSIAVRRQPNRQADAAARKLMLPKVVIFAVARCTRKEEARVRGGCRKAEFRLMREVLSWGGRLAVMRDIEFRALE